MDRLTFGIALQQSRWWGGIAPPQPAALLPVHEPRSRWVPGDMLWSLGSPGQHPQPGDMASNRGSVPRTLHSSRFPRQPRWRRRASPASFPRFIEAEKKKPQEVRNLRLALPHNTNTTHNAGGSGLAFRPPKHPLSSGAPDESLGWGKTSPE